jgi:hypothetical protein
VCKVTENRLQNGDGNSEYKEDRFINEEVSDDKIISLICNDCKNKM